MLSVNGLVLPQHRANVSAFDRGFIWGHSVYECIRLHRDRPFRLGHHLARLRDSAALIGIGPLPSDQQIEVNLASVLASRDVSSPFLIRIIVTAGLALTPELWRLSEPPTIVIAAYPIPSLPAGYYDPGVRAVTSRIRRNQMSPTVSLLTGSQIDLWLAWREAAREGADEAILLNTDGQVCCTSEANIFWVKNDRLFTPAVSCGVVPGIVRELVLEAALDVGIPAYAVAAPLDELAGCDEAFLTGVRIGVAPLATLGGQPVGSGHPGPVTVQMMDVFRQALEAECG